MTSILAAVGDNNIQLLCLSDKEPNRGLPFLVWQSSYDGSWNVFGYLDSGGVSFSKMAAVNNGSDLYVVGLGAADGWPYYFIQDSGGGWRYGGSLPGTKPQGVAFLDLALGEGNDGTPQLFLIRADTSAVVLYSFLNGGWVQGTTPWASSGDFVRIYCGLGNGGNLQVIGIKGGGSLVGLWQSANDGSWNTFTVPPGYNAASSQGEAVMVNGNNGNLQFVYVQGDGSLGLLWQSANDGSWNASGNLLSQPTSGLSFKRLAAAQTPFFFGLSVQLVGIATAQEFPNSPAEAYALSQDFGGNWSWQGVLPTPSTAGFLDVSAAVGNGGNTQVLLLDNDGNVSLYYGVNLQRAPNYIVTNL